MGTRFAENHRAFIPSAVMACLFSASTVVVHTQAAQSAPPKVQKLGNGLYQIGQIRVDTARREIAIPGKVNEVVILEFVANTRDGMKAYESALTLETDAFEFNAALLLIGLDKSRSVAPKVHFDPNPPVGDEVTLHIEWTRGSTPTRTAVEELLFDKDKDQPVPASAWVYTGSGFLEDGRYLAQMDGALIGFVHSPSPIIEQVGGAGVSRFGRIVMNPRLGLEPNTPVVLTVKAVGGADKLPRR
jgi:hypothetical protein